MSSFKDELSALFAQANITAYQIGKDCQISQSNLYTILRGELAASDDVLLKISKHPAIEAQEVTFFDLKAWQTADKKQPEAQAIYSEAARQKKATDRFLAVLERFQQLPDSVTTDHKGYAEARRLASELLQEYKKQ